MERERLTNCGQCSNARQSIAAVKLHKFFWNTSFERPIDSRSLTFKGDSKKSNLPSKRETFT